MRLDYFTRFGEQLFSAHVEDPTYTEWDDVNAWLLDAGENAPNSAIAVWTELLRAGIAEATSGEVNKMPALRDYFDSLVEFPSAAFVAATTMPAFESLMRAIQQSPDAAHPVVDALVKSGWSPAPLLRRIEGERDAILAANRTQKGYSVPLEDTGATGICRMLYPFFCDDKWTPEPNPAYALLFETYVIATNLHLGPDSRFIRNVLQAAPDALYKGLWFARRQEYLEEEHLRALFPMALSSTNAEYALDSLVALLVDEPKAVVGKTMPLLRQYHPELAEMMSMHLSLFPDASAGKTYAEVLTAPYLRLLNSELAPAQEAVDLAVFEESPHGA